MRLLKNQIRFSGLISGKMTRINFIACIFTLKSLCSFSQTSFRPYELMALPFNTTGQVVAIGDVNNDGLNDVVVGANNFFGSSTNRELVFVFAQNARGELSQPTSYSRVNANISTIAIGDVNHDQRNDVIIGYGDNIGIFFQNATGKLNPIQIFASGQGVDGVKCGDLNNDGLTDIAVSHWNTDFVRVFYQTATGFSNITYPKPKGGYDEIDVADVNGDGLEDVVFMAGQLSSGIHVFLQNNTGSLNSYTSYLPPTIGQKTLGGIGIGDLNNDQKNDVIASISSNVPDAGLLLWTQDPGTGLLMSPPVKMDALNIPVPIEIADLNCDEKNEIIVGQSAWLEVSIYEQGALGTYSGYKRVQVPYSSYNPYGLAVGDLNNDGRKDIALADNSRGLVILYNNTKPMNGQVIQVTTVRDTLNGHDYVSSSRATIVDSFERNGYRIRTTSDYRITTTVFQGNVRVDSTVVTKGSICGKDYIDTNRYSAVSYVIGETKNDTTLLSVIADSAAIPLNVRIYPNPTKNLLTIELPYLYSNKNIFISVIDLSGKTNLFTSRRSNKVSLRSI